MTHIRHNVRQSLEDRTVSSEIRRAFSGDEEFTVEDTVRRLNQFYGINPVDASRFVEKVGPEWINHILEDYSEANLKEDFPELMKSLEAGVDPNLVMMDYVEMLAGVEEFEPLETRESDRLLIDDYRVEEDREYSRIDSGLPSVRKILDPVPTEDPTIPAIAAHVRQNFR